MKQRTLNIACFCVFSALRHTLIMAHEVRRYSPLHKEKFEDFSEWNMLFLQSPKFKALFISGRQLQKQRE